MDVEIVLNLHNFFGRTVMNISQIAQDPKIIDGLKKLRHNAHCACSAFTQGQTDRTVVSR